MTYINENESYNYNLSSPISGTIQDQNKNSIIVLRGSATGNRIYLSNNYKKGDVLRIVYAGGSNQPLYIFIRNGCTINSSYGNVSNSSGTDWSAYLNVDRYTMIALVCISASFDGSGNHTQSVWQQMFI